MFSERIRTVRNAEDVRAGRRDWFRFENRGAETDIHINNEIGFFGITAEQFLDELQHVNSGTINLHLNSPGGDVFDGIAIYNALKAHAAAVNVYVESIAASIASVIAMAGDTVTMRRGSMMMIHEPFALAIGDARDMRKMAEALDVMGDSIAAIYAGRAGGEIPAWRAVMAEETWYSADEAVTAKLADRIDGQGTKNTFDLSIFRNGPRTGPPADTPQPAVIDDWRNAARLKVAVARLEMSHALAQ